MDKASRLDMSETGVFVLYIHYINIVLINQYQKGTIFIFKTNPAWCIMPRKKERITVLLKGARICVLVFQ